MPGSDKEKESPKPSRRNLLRKLSVGVLGALLEATPGKHLSDAVSQRSSPQELPSDSIFTPREDARLRMEKGKKKPVA